MFENFSTVYQFSSVQFSSVQFSSVELSWIKEPCVRKFQGHERSKFLGISQTNLVTFQKKEDKSIMDL